MEGRNDDESTKDKKFVGRAKSCVQGPVSRNVCGLKRGSFNNEAVRTLDQALCRLKKSKLVHERGSNFSPLRRGMTSTDMFVDSMSSNHTNNASGYDNASLMSVNFSQYDLARNLSSIACDSEDTFSDATGNTYSIPGRSLKDEHLERYFRSAEIWRRRCREGYPGGSRFYDISEK